MNDAAVAEKIRGEKAQATMMAQSSVDS